MLQPLPSGLITPTRNQLIQYFLRDYAIHNPTARIDPGSEPYLKASVMADTCAPIYYDAILIAKNTSRATRVGVALDDDAVSLGTQRLPAIGASGSVVISAYASGTTIFQGDVFVIGSNQYVCMATALYLSGAQVPIQGSSTGPGTNQLPGTVGQWQTPRPGCALNATVATQADGSGLDGGHTIESDNELRQRLNFLAANPPASGNDAQIQEIASRCPGLSIEQVYTFPCALGPSSTCVAFTMRATSLGATRIPNAAQLATMLAWLQSPGQLPADLTITVAAIISSPLALVLEPAWAVGFPGWIDASPWPAFTSVDHEPQIAVPTAGAISATYFRVWGGFVEPLPVAPSVGQSIAVFDAPNLTFRRKKILSYTADLAGGYDITVDTTEGVSDTSYVPVTGQFVCPWSDSLNSLVLPVVAYLASLGPGEQFASFVDPGSRQRRNPASPAVWPSTLSLRILAGPTTSPIVAQGQPTPVQPPSLVTLTSLADIGVIETASLPYSPPTGSPGASCYLITLGDLTGYPNS
jgi:hypothetical protein